MPLNYLNAGPEDVYALNRLGSTFSDMVIGLQQNRIRQQQILAQQAMEQARIQLEREAQHSNELTARALRQRYGAETDYRKAGAELSKAKTEQTLNIGQAGRQMGRDLQLLGDYPPDMEMAKALRSDIIGRSGEIAATHPSDIGLQAAQLMDLNDPIIRHLIATKSRATATVPQGSSLIDLTSPGAAPMFTSSPRVSLRTPEQESSERLRALGSVVSDLSRAHQARTPQYTNTVNALNATLSQIPGGAPPAAPQVPKPGDIYKGYRFKGGDLSDKANWEPVQQ